MAKREKQTAPDPIPAGYTPEPGDGWVRVVDLRRKHQERVFEARGSDGAGVRGALVDVQWHMLHGLVLLQFRDFPQWFRSGVDGWLLMKPEGWTEPPPAEPSA
jgi:hypothetical protein